MAPSCDYRSGISLLASVLCAACLTYGTNGELTGTLVGKTAINSTSLAPVTQPSQIITSLFELFTEAKQDDIIQRNSSKNGNFPSSKDAGMSSASEAESSDNDNGKKPMEHVRNSDKVTQSSEEDIEKDFGDIFWPIFTVMEDPIEAGYPTRKHRPPFVDEGDKDNNNDKDMTGMSTTPYRKGMDEEATTWAPSVVKTTEKLMESISIEMDTMDNTKISESRPLTTAAVDVDVLQTTHMKMLSSSNIKKEQHTVSDLTTEAVTSAFFGVPTTNSPKTVFPKTETLPNTELSTTIGYRVPGAASETSTARIVPNISAKSVSEMPTESFSENLTTTGSESQFDFETSPVALSDTSTTVLTRSSEAGMDTVTKTESTEGKPTTESPAAVSLNNTTTRLVEKLPTTTQGYQTTPTPERQSTPVHEIEVTFIEIPVTPSTGKTEVSTSAVSNTNTPKLVERPVTTELSKGPSHPENKTDLEISTTRSLSTTSVIATELPTTAVSNMTTLSTAENLQTAAPETTLVPEIVTSAGRTEVPTEKLSTMTTPKHVDMPLTTGQGYASTAIPERPSMPLLENATSAEAWTTRLQHASSAGRTEAGTTAGQRKTTTSEQFVTMPTVEFLTEVSTTAPGKIETSPIPEIPPTTSGTPHSAQVTTANTTSVLEQTSEVSKGQMPTINGSVLETVSTPKVEKETRTELSYERSTMTPASEPKSSTVASLSTITSTTNESFTSVGIQQTASEETSSKSLGYGVYNVTSISSTTGASTPPAATSNEMLTSTNQESSIFSRLPATTLPVLEDTMSYEADVSESPSSKSPTTESEEPTVLFIEETTAFEELPTTIAGQQMTISATESTASTKTAVPVTQESSNSPTAVVKFTKEENSSVSTAVGNITVAASTTPQQTVTKATAVVENTTVPVTTSTPESMTTGSSVTDNSTMFTNTATPSAITIGSSARASDTSSEVNITEESTISAPLSAQSVTAGSEDYTAVFVPLSSTESSDRVSTTEATPIVSSYAYHVSGEVSGSSSTGTSVITEGSTYSEGTTAAEQMKNATTVTVSQSRTSPETTAGSTTIAGLLLNNTSGLMEKRTTSSSLESTAKLNATTILPELVSDLYPSSSKRSTEIMDVTDTSETYSGEIVTEYIRFENETESTSVATSKPRSSLTSAVRTTDTSATSSSIKTWPSTSESTTPTSGETSASKVTREEVIMNITQSTTESSTAVAITLTLPSSSPEESTASEATEMETALFVTGFEPLPPTRSATTGRAAFYTQESTISETVVPTTGGLPELENSTVPKASLPPVPGTTVTSPVPTTMPPASPVPTITVSTTLELTTTTVQTTPEPTTKTVPKTPEPTTTTVPTTPEPTTTTVPTTLELTTTTVPLTPEPTTTVPTTTAPTTVPTTPEPTITTVPKTPEPTTTTVPTTPEPTTTTVPTTFEPTTTTIPTTPEPTPTTVPTTPEPTPTTVPTTPEPTITTVPTTPEPTITTVPTTPEPTTTTVPTTSEPTTTTVPTTFEPTTTTVPTTSEPTTTTVPTTFEPTTTTVPTTPQPTTTTSKTPELTAIVTTTPATPAPTTKAKSTTEVTTMTPPSPNDVELSGKFKITGGVEWNDALSDKTSPEYKQLNSKMNETIATTLKKTSAGDSFVRISKIDFKKGSVDVEYLALFRPDTVIEVQDVEKTFQNEIANGTAFEGFTVDPNSTSFIVITPQPSSVVTRSTTATTEVPLTTASSLVPNWAIGIIIAAAILVIFIIIVVIVMCCTNNRKRKQQTYRIPRTAGKMIKEEGARYTIDPDTAGKYVVYVEKRPIDGDNGTVLHTSNDASSRQRQPQHHHHQHSPLSINTSSYDGHNSVDLERNNSSSSASTLLARPIRMMPSPEGQANNAMQEELIDMNEICVVDETTNVTKPLDVTLDVTATASGTSRKLNDCNQNAISANGRVPETSGSGESSPEFGICLDSDGKCFYDEMAGVWLTHL